MDNTHNFSKLTRKDTPRPKDEREEKRRRLASPGMEERQTDCADDNEERCRYREFLESECKDSRGDSLELLPLTAIRGVSGDCALALQELFGIRTIGDLARCPILTHAQQIQQAALRHPYEDAGLFDTNARLPARFDSVPLTESVCGKDERLRVDATAEPFNAICFLTLERETGSRSRGTGFYVDLGGDYKGGAILTAGHCLHEHGKMYKRIRVARARSGEDIPHGMQTYEEGKFRVTTRWIQTYAQEEDYGLVLLDRPNPVPGFRLKVADDATLVGGTITTAGYPADKDGFHMWMDRGPVKYVKEGKIFYNEDTFGGQSGSPVWIRSDDGIECVGIHSYGGCPNSATRITQTVLDQIKSWVEEQQ